MSPIETTTPETQAELTIEERLALITAAMETKQAEADEASQTSDEVMACPIDPAERALCDSCQ